MTTNENTFELASNYLRLKPDATIEVMPVDEHFWPKLIGGEMGSFNNEYLVTHLNFSEDWPSWEVHPNGDEIVFLISGSAEFVLEAPDGEITSVQVNQAGHYVFVPQGYWHTAKISEATSMLFITAGEGTQNRPV